METSQKNQAQSTQNKFRVKLIGKSYVGKTTFINKINNPDFTAEYEKSNMLTNYKINFKYQYKTDVFYFDEEPEQNLDNPSSSDNLPGKNDYIALLFMFDVNEKESFDYILKSYEKIYSANQYMNIIKIIISNKMDLDEKLRQVNKEEIDNAIKQFSALFFEISSKNSEQVYNIISQIYTKMKSIVRINEYFYGTDHDSAYFIEKEKLMPNYYEIIIMGDRDTGKNCLKNKFLYDCGEKNVSLYEFLIPRSVNLGGKDIKFDISIKYDEKAKANEFHPEFFYNALQNLDPNHICILLTYDIANKTSINNVKKIIAEILDYTDRYKLCISILGMKCDLLMDNEIEERVKEGTELAKIINAHYYLVSTKTGYNVDAAFYDILVQAYNKYHKMDSIPTNNYYKESVINEKSDIYSDIYVRNEKPKMKEKEKKKVEKQIEKDANIVKKLKTQKDATLNTRKKKENDVYCNQYKEILRLNYPKIYRCSKCWKIPKVEINENNNSVKVKCFHNNTNTEQNYKINQFIDTQSKIPDITQCNICKSGNYNHSYTYDYCYNCEKIFCKKCDNNHKNSKECDKKEVIPFYLMESFCNIHELPAKYYCLNCNKYTCDTCFTKEHENHNFKFYDKDYVDKLIKENKKLIESTKNCYKYLEAYFNDLMKSIRNKFNDLLDLKMKKLSIKENLIKDLELYKNNFNLIESVADLKFEDVKLKSLRYNANYRWKNKLDIIFDYLNEPLYIKNTNICIKYNIGKPFNILQEIKKQSKEEMEKEKEKKIQEEKKEEKKEEENKEEQNEPAQNEIIDINGENLSGNLKIEEAMMDNLKVNNMNASSENLINMEGNPDDILITDICALSSKFFGISSDDGLLKIYSAYNYTEKPYNTIKEYLPNKGIYSLYKPNKGIHLNFNPLYLIGFEVIKKLIFDNEYKDYNISEEYKIDNCSFTNIIELLDINGILISTLDQSILNVYKDREKKLIKTDLTYLINEYKANKIIVSISEIGSNKFSIKLKDDKAEEITDVNVNMEKYRLRRRTIGNKLRKDESQNLEEKSKDDNKINIYNTILELNQNEKTGEISSKSIYEFYKNFDIIGKICSYYLLVVDKNTETIPSLMHLFDFKNNIFIKRYYLNQNIPTFYHKLENWYNNDEVFLLLDNKMNLTQYFFDDEKNKELRTLFSLDLKEIITKKNRDDNIILLNVGDKIFLFANNGIIFKINN